MVAHVGIDVGGTTTIVVSTAPDGNVFTEDETPTGDDGTGAWRGNVRTVFQTLLKELDSSPESMGLCAPGIAAPDGSCINWMPGRLNGLEGLDWQKELGVNIPVRVLNDAQAALLAEVWIGRAKGCRNVALLTLGTGVGGAILCDGILLRGTIGRAGHLGHVSLDPQGSSDIVNAPGSLEDAIGNATLETRSAGRWTDSLELVRAYDAGDADATQVWLNSVQALAAAIVSIENVVDPEVVLLGGGMVQAGASLFEPLRRFHDEFEWRPGGHRVRIEPVALGARAGAIGAAYYGMHFEELVA